MTARTEVFHVLVFTGKPELGIVKVFSTLSIRRISRVTHSWGGVEAFFRSSAIDLMG